MALSNRQQIFVAEYVKCWNGCEAARRAGYSTPRISATDNMQNPAIQEAIKSYLATHTISAEIAMSILAQQATASFEDFITVHDNGEIEPNLLKAQKKGVLGAVKKVTFHPNGRVQSVELHDPQKALEIILKELHLEAGESTENVNISDNRDELHSRLSRLIGRRDPASVPQQPIQ